MPSVDLETSVISYLTVRPSSHLITAAHQLITTRWWESRRSEFELRTSELVLEEASRGDREAASRRLALLREIPLVAITASASAVATSIVKAHLLPDRAFADALHIATAAVHSLEYLLTWNCSHIANAELLPRVTALVEKEGLTMPFVCTPEELLGERQDA